MWNQTGEADWGSEMDRHSPTGPWLCCQRSVDYMTEGGMEGSGWHEDVNGVCTGGVIPMKRLPSLRSFHKSSLYTVIFVSYANQLAVGLVCRCTAQQWVVWLLLLTVTTLIIPNGLEAAIFPPSTLTMIRWPFPRGQADNLWGVTEVAQCAAHLWWVSSQTQAKHSTKGEQKVSWTSTGNIYLYIIRGFGLMWNLYDSCDKRFIITIIIQPVLLGLQHQNRISQVPPWRKHSSKHVVYCIVLNPQGTWVQRLNNVCATTKQ